LGRKDSLPKIRGQKVEPAEIESALLRIDGVREAAVAAWEAAGHEARLAAYVVPSGLPAPTPERLRTALSQSLPPALVPAVFVTLDALPLDPNGKVDRRALPPPAPPARRADAFVPPAGRLERRIAQAWERVLDVSPIGARDDFHDLGGDSLDAA